MLGIPAIRKPLFNLTDGSISPGVSDNAIYEFSKKAVANGLDIFRVFDSLNYFGMSSSARFMDDTYSLQRMSVLILFLHNFDY